MVTLSSTGIFYLYKKLADDLKEASASFTSEIKVIATSIQDIDKKLAVKSTCMDYLTDEFEELKSMVMKNYHTAKKESR